MSTYSATAQGSISNISGGAYAYGGVLPFLQREHGLNWWVYLGGNKCYLEVRDLDW